MMEKNLLLNSQAHSNSKTVNSWRTIQWVVAIRTGSGVVRSILMRRGASPPTQPSTLTLLLTSYITFPSQTSSTNIYIAKNVLCTEITTDNTHHVSFHSFTYILEDLQRKPHKDKVALDIWLNLPTVHVAKENRVEKRSAKIFHVGVW